MSAQENVNLFNGNLNFSVPLYVHGGRGGVSFPSLVKLEQRWQIKVLNVLQDGGRTYEALDAAGIASDLAGGGPNTVVGRRGGSSDRMLSDGPCVTLKGIYATTLTRLTFTGPDGSEVELRDHATSGRPHVSNTCDQWGPSRGRVFIAADGSGTAFVATADVHDYKWIEGLEAEVASENKRLFYPSGHLLFRNGSRYEVIGGNVVSMRDRNGNKILLGSEIIDPLGRSGGVWTQAGCGQQVTFPGFGSPSGRVVSICRAPLHDRLRKIRLGDSHSPKKYEDLFQGILWNHSQNQAAVMYDPSVIASIIFPNNSRYEFYYNEYGELARVVLPSGGSYEYDWEGAGPAEGDLRVMRWVKQRRVYGSGGALEGTTTYTRERIHATGDLNVLVTAHDAAGIPIAQSRHYFHGDPQLDTPGGATYPRWRDGREYRTDVYDAHKLVNNLHPLLRSQYTEWTQDPMPWETSVSQHSPPNNTRVKYIDTKLSDTSQVTRQEFEYDQYNNVKDEKIYEYGPGQPGRLIKHTTTTYQYYGDPLAGAYFPGLADKTSVYSVAPDGKETLFSSTQIIYDEYAQYPLIAYDNEAVPGWENPGGVRGNPTTVRRWLNTDDTWVETHAQFDQLGNVRKSWDALGRLSEMSYKDKFTDAGGQLVDHHTYSLPTQWTSPIPDGEGHSSAAALVSSAGYDYHSGLVKTSTDANNQTTTFEYNDPLNRLKKVTNPTGGGWTGFDYGDVVGNLYVKTTTTLDEGRNVESYAFFDGLGRSVRSFSPKGGGVWVVADTQYDAAGRVRRVSKPYQTVEPPSISGGVNPAGNWVTTEYDALGRAVKVTTADGSQAETSYLGNIVTSTDAALRKRKVESDALGRLTQVVEDPGGLNYVTSYKYDVLGNLREVEQGPAEQRQRRHYAYDSLSRLVLSRNPEQDVNPDLVLKDADGVTLNDPVTGNSQWTTKTDYYANGDVSARTDARGIKIEYFYDNLNRLIRRTYAETRALPAGTHTATPAVDLYYDGRGFASAPANSRGKLTRVSSSAAETRYTAFDEMGRVKSSEQEVDGQTYAIPSYVYNLAGSLVSQVYPSGRVVKNDYDEAGDLSAVSGRMPGQNWKPYASDFDYSLTNAGATSRVKLGNGRWESTVFNQRLQPTLVGLGTAQDGTDLMKLEYGYGTTDNNGNIRTQKITVPASGGSQGFTAEQTYGYDSLNRLDSAVERSGGQESWRQTFGYDRFGNRKMITAQNAAEGQAPTTPELVGEDPAVSAATNRITPRAGDLYFYDAAGNLVRDRAGNSYSFDGENMQAAYTHAGAGQAAAQYFYDGSGRRVKKVVGGATTVFVYNAFGELVAEYATQAQPSADPTTYVTADHLGTPRVSTGGGGAVKARHDYLPFGGELSGYAGRGSHAEYRADSLRQQFTGYERDAETGLDYAQARYYASGAGRFTGVDPLMASASTASPQTFNRYTYALNNPYRYTDPTGMEPGGWDEELGAGFAQLGALTDAVEERRWAEREAARRAGGALGGAAAAATQQTGPQNSQQGQAPQQPEQQQSQQQQETAPFVVSNVDELERQADARSHEGYQDSDGSYQCASLPQRWQNDQEPYLQRQGNQRHRLTPNWLMGEGVSYGMPLQRGTVLATFDREAGIYRSLRTGNHTVIFVGWDSGSGGMKVIEQFAGTPRTRIIAFDSTAAYHSDAGRFNVVRLAVRPPTQPVDIPCKKCK